MTFLKLRNLHIYFFYLFLFSVPFQTRMVFLTEYSFYSGDFTEYSTFFLYASDIFLILALFFWLILDRNNIKRFNFKKFKDAVRKNIIWRYLTLFILILILNLFLKRDYFDISFFYFLKILEMIVLCIYVYFNLRKEKILLNSLFIAVISGFLQGVIAIKQFVSQSSIFYNYPILRKISGESLIGSDIPGVAKFVFEGQKIVRSYGTFPHPNVLGGFLIFTILITVFLYLESKSGYLSSKISNIKLLSQCHNTNGHKCQGIFYSLLWILLIFVQVSALFLTFSRVSCVGFIIAVGILFFIYIAHKYNVSRETIDANSFSLDKGRLGGFCDESQYSYRKKQMIVLSMIGSYIRIFVNYIKCSVKKVSKIVSRETISSKIINYYKKLLSFIMRFKELAVVSVLLIYLIISNFSIIQVRLGDNLLSNGSLPSNYAISDRSFYNNVSRETLSDNILFGSGLGTSIFQIDKYAKNNNIDQKIESWQYQPTHNIYYLIASEIGLFGLMIFLLIIVNIILYSFNRQIVSRETIIYKKLNYYLFAIFLSFLFIGLFDHYFWTLQQGQLMFWMILGLLLIVNSGGTDK